MKKRITRIYRKGNLGQGAITCSRSTCMVEESDLEKTHYFEDKDPRYVIRVLGPNYKSYYDNSLLKVTASSKKPFYLPGVMKAIMRLGDLMGFEAKEEDFIVDYIPVNGKTKKMLFLSNRLCEVLMTRKELAPWFNPKYFIWDESGEYGDWGIYYR